MNNHATENLAGRLNQRIVLQQSVRTSDGAGGASVTWQDIATLWAEIIAIRSTETFTHDKLEPNNIYVVTMRYRADITTKMRFMLGSRILLITGIRNVDEEKQILKIDVREEL